MTLSEQLDLELPSDVTSTKPPQGAWCFGVFDEMTQGISLRVSISQLNPEELRSVVRDYEVTQFASEKIFLRAADPEGPRWILGKSVIEKKLPNGSSVDWVMTDVTEGAPEAFEGNRVMVLTGISEAKILALSSRIQMFRNIWRTTTTI